MTFINRKFGYTVIIHFETTRVKLQILLHYLLISSQFTGAKPIHINEVCDFGFQRAVLTLILMPRKTDKQVANISFKKNNMLK